MPKIENVTELRKLLLSNGYEPLANFDKRCFLTGWADLEITDALIDKWGRNHRDIATGLRLTNLIMLDLDVTHKEANLAIFAAWLKAYPEYFEDCLERGTTASCKRAFFFRAEEKLGTFKTRRFLPAGSDGGDEAQFVELFAGGSTPRQAGAFGPHKRSKDGTVLSEYVWLDDISPADVPLRGLPALKQEVCERLIDIAEDIFIRWGFKPAPGSKRSHSTGETWVYDLTDDMVFQTKDHGRLSLEQLKQAAKDETDGIRLSASWWDKTSDNLTAPRCIARHGGSAGFFIIDFDTDQRHLEKDREPKSLDRIFNEARDHREAENSESPTPEMEEDQMPKDPMEIAIKKAEEICRTHAFCGTALKPIIPLDATSMDSGMTISHFRDLLMPFNGIRYGPRGGIQTISPVELWLRYPGRLAVEGLEMRPDMPTPLFKKKDSPNKLFTEDRWVNTYHPPAHPATGGDAQTGIDYMRQLVPNERERKWFLQWLAHKFRNAAIPGPGVILVAREAYGTGRSTMSRLLGLLFGEAYVKSLPYHMFAGKSYQSQYNSWQAESLFCVISEAQELQGSPRWSVGQDTYTHLRELIEPGATMRLIVRKGWNNCYMMSFTTYLVLTNHMDAVPLPENDRRLAVFEGGKTQPEEYWTKLNRWMDDPANIAAFARWLEQIDLAGYSPYSTPIMTEAKRAMALIGLTDLERGLRRALACLKNRNTDLFSMAHVLYAMRMLEKWDGLRYPPEKWERIVGRMVMGQCHPVGEHDPHEHNDSRQIVYAWSFETALKWKDAEPELIKAQLLRTGDLKQSFDFLKALRDTKE